MAPVARMSSRGQVREAQQHIEMQSLLPWPWNSERQNAMGALSCTDRWQMVHHRNSCTLPPAHICFAAMGRTWQLSKLCPILWSCFAQALQAQRCGANSSCALVLGRTAQQRLQEAAAASLSRQLLVLQPQETV